MTSGTRIEQVGESFADLLAALHQQCFETSPEEAWSAASIADMFGLPGLIALVVSRGEEPLGFLLARSIAGEAEILSVGVVPKARGARLGEALLTRLHEIMEKGTANPRILLDVAADNEAARALYTRAGYLEVGRRKAYYHRANGVSVDSLTMCREFAQKD